MPPSSSSLIQQLLPQLIIIISFLCIGNFYFPHVAAAAQVSQDPPCFYGWGKNDKNQLDASMNEEYILQPTSIGHGVLHGKNITYISTGTTHSVIVDSDGYAYCFGSNSKGECGQGVTGGDLSYPKRISSDDRYFYAKNIVSSFLGKSTTYLLDNVGQVYHMGLNHLVEVSPSSYNVPMGMSFPHVVSSVSSGDGFELLLTENGEAYGFGNGFFGQLGPNVISRVVHVPVSILANSIIEGKTITEISAGAYHSLVLTSDGEVFSFGKNDAGQLGNGKISFTEIRPQNVSDVGILYGLTITQISAGESHTLVLSSDGEVYAFGRNSHGELGMGSTSDSEPFPVAVNTSGILRDVDIKQVSAGGSHSLVLSLDGKVFGFGGNQEGQLGIGSTSLAVPLPVSNGVLHGKIITQVSAGGHHSLVLSSDGKVYGFGANLNGQLGLRSFLKYADSPTVIPQGFVTQNLNITAMSSSNHALYRDSKGNVVAAGDNLSGQVGDGSLITPRVASRVGTEFEAFQVSAGGSHSLVLSADGKVYGFGHNNNYQLGTKTNVDKVSLPVAASMDGILRGKTIIQLSAGGYHSLVLSSDGKVYGFGRNIHGELGIGSISDREPFPVAVNTSGALFGKTISQISTGDDHSLVLSSDGEVFGFGRNQYHQLGLMSVSDEIYFPTSVNTSGVLRGKVITQISAGTSFSLVLSSDGEVFAFGENLYGQCGTGSASHVIPLPVAVRTDGVLRGKIITQISAGGLHCLALSSDGNIYGWGSNSDGQLGIASSLFFSPLPVAVNTSRVGFPRGAGVAKIKVFAGEFNSFLSYCHSRECFDMDHLHPLVCSNHGSCVGDDLCSCDDGYTGSECESPICSGIAAGDAARVCSGHGNCTGVDQCECAHGYEGRDCENFRCFGVLNTDSFACQGHGECVAPGKCTCQRDYEGDICNIWMNCFGIASSDTARVCSGRGECAEINTCECAWPWAGLQCESWRGEVWFMVISGCIGAVLVVCLFGGTCSGIIVTTIGLFKRVKRVEKEKKLTEYLLQGFVRDTEMDTVDADSQRARLIVQKSMLEIDFSELSELQKIGSGGSGAILFRAKWNDSVVAVKVFKSGLMSGDTFFDEFEHEVSLMSTLRHRNVINFYGCSLAYPRIAIVMELCEAGSVETLIENGAMQKKSSHEILQMLLDVAEGMSFLHSREVIHRDLKCANVLVDEHGVCKLTDFGLSKYTKDQVEKAHTVGIGTSYYVPPELANGSGEYDSSVDVYAFGIMAMEMCLCRMCPFPGVTDSKHTNDVQRRALQDPTYRPDVSSLDSQYSFLQWVLQQCWNENPKSRPPFRDIVKILRSSLFDTDQ